MRAEMNIGKAKRQKRGAAPQEPIGEIRYTHFFNIERPLLHYVLLGFVLLLQAKLDSEAHFPG